MKSLIRSLLSLATLDLISKDKPKTIPTPSKDARGESLTLDDLRALFNGYQGLMPSRGANGMIAIRRAARTTNQRKRRKDYRRKIAAGMA